MSAAKRTRLHTTWLSPRNAPSPPASFKCGVLTEAGAKDAFQTLTADGCNKDLLWRHLWGLAWLAKNDTKHLFALHGLPPHTLRRFPDRVRRMSDDIEALDGEIRSNQPYKQISQLLPFFLAGAIPKAEIEVRRGDNVLLRSVGTETRAISADSARNLLERQDELPKLAGLPKLLRLYADYVEALYKITAFYGPKGRTLPGRNMPHELVAFVEASAGKPHWDRVTTLVNASYRAIGCDLEVDSKALGMQRTRSKK